MADARPPKLRGCLSPEASNWHHRHMTRFAIDAVVAIRLLREGRVVPEHHQLVAPAGLRSEVLARLYRNVRVGVLTDRDGRQLLDTLAGLKRLLPAAKVEYVEKQPTLEEIFLALVGTTTKDPS